MKLYTIKIASFLLLGSVFLSSCSDDDDTQVDDPVAMATCTDGIMNGDEEGIDCGGSCPNACDDGMEGMDPEEPDFSGTYAQADHMGRPGINTTLGFDIEGEASVKDAQNVTIPSEMVAAFQVGYEARLEAYHDVYAGLLGADPEAVNYEPNILGDILNGPENDGTMNNPVTATVLTTLLAADVLQVAPNAPTTYFNGGTGAPNFEGAIGLTGRTPQDDIIDVSLILFFGGATGDRFSGQDNDGDGVADLPRLTSDGVSLTADISTTFPYLGAPE